MTCHCFQHHCHLSSGHHHPHLDYCNRFLAHLLTHLQSVFPSIASFRSITWGQATSHGVPSQIRVQAKVLYSLANHLGSFSFFSFLFLILLSFIFVAESQVLTQVLTQGSALTRLVFIHPSFFPPYHSFPFIPALHLLPLALLKHWKVLNITFYGLHCCKISILGGFLVHI